jgi:hypothetical protein
MVRLEMVRMKRMVGPRSRDIKRSLRSCEGTFTGFTAMAAI